MGLKKTNEPKNEVQEDVAIEKAVKSVESKFIPSQNKEQDETINQIGEAVAEQSTQLNPDAVQESGHWPSTESLLAPPVSRPHTIDPNTGHIVYAGEATALPGGQVEHEADG